MTGRQHSPFDVENVAINLGTVISTLQMVIECNPRSMQHGDIHDVLALCRNHLSDQQRKLEQISEGVKPPLEAVAE